MISPIALKNLFEQIAKVHPGIGHDPDNSVIRFYSFNQDEAISGERGSDDESIGYPRLGLSLRTHTGLNGQYQNQSSATLDNLNIDVVLLNTVPLGDFDAEYQVYEDLKQVLDDIITWLLKVATTDLSCSYPIVQLIDLDNLVYKKIGPVHSNAYGWTLQLQLRESLVYTNTNPLNNMP